MSPLARFSPPRPASGVRSSGNVSVLRIMVTDEMDSGVETSSINGNDSPAVDNLEATVEDIVGEPASDIVPTPLASQVIDRGHLGEAPREILAAVEEPDEDLDDDFDETLAERLYGLTEMFPPFVRNGVYSLCENSCKGAKWFYGFSRSATWILCSSAVVLLAAPTIESERAQMQKQMQRQLLLGPGAGGGPGGMIGMAPSPPPPSKSEM